MLECLECQPCNDDFTQLSDQLYPLQCADDIADLIIAMAQVSFDDPNRADSIARLLPGYAAHRATEVGRLVGRLASESGFSDLISTLARTLPLTDGAVIVPEIKVCAVEGCGGSLSLRRDARNTISRPNRQTVYSAAGEHTCRLFLKRCDKCQALYDLTSAEGGLLLPAGEQLPLRGATERSSRWFQASSQTVVETSLLYRYEAQALHSHTGVETFGNELRTITESNFTDNFDKTFSHAYFAWSLLRWRAEEGSPPAALSGRARARDNKQTRAAAPGDMGDGLRLRRAH
jgi:hypothetical protein